MWHHRRIEQNTIQAQFYILYFIILVSFSECIVNMNFEILPLAW